MSHVATTAVWTRSRVKGAMHHVLAAFAEFANADGICWPSQSTIADRLQVDERWVRRVIAALVAAGELIPVGKRKRGVIAYRIACLDDGYEARASTKSPKATAAAAAADGSYDGSYNGSGGQMTRGTGGQMTRGRESDTHKTPGDMTRGRDSTPDENVKGEQPPTPVESDGGDSDPIDQAVTAWNALAGELGLATVGTLSKSRRQKLQAILADHGVDAWREALTKVRASIGLQGNNDAGFVVTLPWLCDEDKFTDVRDGRYDGWTRKRGNGGGNGQLTADERKRFQEIESIWEILRGELPVLLIGGLVDAGLTLSVARSLLADPEMMARAKAGVNREQTAGLITELNKRIEEAYTLLTSKGVPSADALRLFKEGLSPLVAEAYLAERGLL